MTPTMNVHTQVITTGGLILTLSFKTNSAKQLTELDDDLLAAGIKPYTFATSPVGTQPAASDASPNASTSDATLKTPETPPAPAQDTKVIEPKLAKPTTPPPAEKKQLPMPDFIPQNETEIVDIEVRQVDTREKIAYIGKTEDGSEVKIDKRIREQIQAIGFDTSTWDTPDPHIRKTITVTTNTYGVIQQVKNSDGVWTWARISKNIKVGDLLCLRSEEGNLTYHKVLKNGRFTIEFEGTHPAIDNTGTCYVCLTEPPAKEIIPF